MTKENDNNENGKSGRCRGKPDDRGETMPHPAERVLLSLVDKLD